MSSLAADGILVRDVHGVPLEPPVPQPKGGKYHTTPHHIAPLGCQGQGLFLRLAPPPFTEATKVNGMEVEEEEWGSAAPRDLQVNVTRKVCEVRASPAQTGSRSAEIDSLACAFMMLYTGSDLETAKTPQGKAN